MKKSNIEKVKVSVCKDGTDYVKVTYYSGRTRTMTISNMSETVKEFITGNLNTIVKETDEHVITYFYGSTASLSNSIAVISEQIVKRCMNSTITTKYTFGGKRFTINANDFKIQCGKLYYSIGLNRAVAINLIESWDFNKSREVRDRIISHFKG